MLKEIVKLGAIAPLLCVMAGCGSSDDGNGNTAAPAQTQAQAQPAQAMDGTTVIRGLFFGIGPAAAMLPEVWSQDRVEEIRKQTLALPPAELAEKMEKAAVVLREAGNVQGADYSSQIAAALRSGAVTPAQLDRKSSDSARETQANAIIARMTAADPSFEKTFLASIQSGNPVRVDAAMKDAAKRIGTLVFAVEPSGNIADQRGTVGWFWGPEQVAVLVDYVVAAAGFVAAGAVVLVLAFADQTDDSHDRFTHETLVQNLATRFGCAGNCFNTVKL